MPQTSRCAVAGSSTSMTEPWVRAIGACDERSHCRRMEPASYIKAQEEARNGNAEHSCQHLFGAELRQLDPANEEVRWAIRQSVSARRVPSSMRGAGAYGFGFPSLSMPPMPSIPSHDCRLFLLFRRRVGVSCSNRRVLSWWTESAKSGFALKPPSAGTAASTSSVRATGSPAKSTTAATKDSRIEGRCRGKHQITHTGDTHYI